MGVGVQERDCGPRVTIAKSLESEYEEGCEKHPSFIPILGQPNQDQPGHSNQDLAANYRKEYFRVTLDEVREAVKASFGEVTFRIDHEALQYRESEDIRRKGLASEVPIGDDEEPGE